MPVVDAAVAVDVATVALIEYALDVALTATVAIVAAVVGVETVDFSGDVTGAAAAD